MIHRPRHRFGRPHLLVPLGAILLVEIALPSGTAFARPADPAFLQRFADSIRSGDHLRIQAALVEAARATSEVIRDNPVARSPGRAIREDPRPGEPRG